jgi:uncharacterized membrane protein YjgN (DUF898 family)
MSLTTFAKIAITLACLVVIAFVLVIVHLIGSSNATDRRCQQAGGQMVRYACIDKRVILHP